MGLAVWWKLRGLRSRDAGKRALAADALAKLGEAALDRLAAALRDGREDAATRAEVVGVLARIGGPTALESLITGLGEHRLWRATTTALTAFGDEAVARLIRAVGDSSWGVASGAIYVLGEMKEPAAIGPMLAAIEAGNDVLCAEVAKAMAKMGSQAVEPLLAALDSGTWYARGAGARALGTIGDQRAVDPLFHLLREPYANRPGQRDGQIAAADALCRLGVSLEAVGESLYESIRHYTKEQRHKLMDTTDSVPMLFGAARLDDDAWVCSAVVRTVVKHEDPRAFAALWELVARLPSGPNTVSAEAIVKRGTVADLDRFITLAEKTDDDRLHERCARALYKLGGGDSKLFMGSDFVPVGTPEPERAVAALARLLSHRHPRVRSEAAQSLGLLHATRLCGEIGKLMQDEDVRRGAALALGNLKHDDGVDALVGALCDPAPKVREYAQDSLRRIGTARARAALVREDSPRPNVPAESFAEALVCPGCRTIYNRKAVVAQLPAYIVDSAVWSTRFKCIECRAEVWISGHSESSAPTMGCGRCGASLAGAAMFRAYRCGKCHMTYCGGCAGNARALSCPTCA